jgi:hypothetical protein
MNRLIDAHKNHNLMNLFFQLYFISVNDVVGVMIMNDSEQLDMNML